MIDRFSPKAIAALDHYVYVYSDPDTRQPFYVGKGVGNRAFSHLKDQSESDKVRAIADIRARGKEPVIEVLAHGLDEETAFKVEAAAIDLIGVGNLTNRVRGHHSGLFGRIEAGELNARYDHGVLEEGDFIDDVVLIKVNKAYRNGMSAFELYEATRGDWVVNRKRAEEADYALAVYFGMVLEVYQIAGWFPAGSTALARKEGSERDPNRMEFVGRVANSEVRDRYVGKSVAGLFKPGAANPIRYIRAT